MKKKSFVISALYLLSMSSFGQSLSLKQCIDYAIQSNATVAGARYDVDIAATKVKEQIGGMLPQVDASTNYTDNLNLATTLLPGAMVGKTDGSMVPVQFGTQHNMNASLTVTQKLFDPTSIVALKAAKVNEGQASQTLKLTKEQVAYSVSATYYQTLVIGKQLNTLRSTLKSSETLLKSTELKLQNGVAKSIDVDKIRVSYNNLLSQLQQSELSYKQSLNNLKYYMGMPVDKELALSDTTLRLEATLMNLPNNGLNVENRSDYQLQKIVVQAYELDEKRNIAAYLPTLNLTFNSSTNAMRKAFNFTDGSLPWFKSSALVFSLKLPIFDWFQKQQRIEQSKLNMEKAKVKVTQTEQSIRVDVANYENQYRTAISNIRNEQSNLQLSENVYRQTQLLYQQGMATSVEMVQAESSYNESTNTYYSKLLNLYIARVNLEQAKGNLLNYINTTN
jgi:outer membrane protein TolC